MKSGAGHPMLLALSGVARELAELIRERQPCVVLTGAGMSTESGLPDFRSAAGIWQEVDPTEVATIDAFRRDPERVWGWYGPRIRSFLDVEPNAGHVALAGAGAGRARRGDRDAEHRHAAHARRERRTWSRCTARSGGRSASPAARRSTWTAVLEQLGRAPVPRCHSVWRRSEARRRPLRRAACRSTRSRGPSSLRAQAALLLVVGSSLQVWPVAGLPEQTLANGGTVAIVNREPTPYDDAGGAGLAGRPGARSTAVAGLLASAVAIRRWLRASCAP